MCDLEEMTNAARWGCTPAPPSLQPGAEVPAYSTPAPGGLAGPAPLVLKQASHRCGQRHSVLPRPAHHQHAVLSALLLLFLTCFYNRFPSLVFLRHCELTWIPCESQVSTRKRRARTKREMMG